MLVSNFVLGFVDYYHFDTGWTSAYELQVTNLADVEINFDVEWRITSHYFGGANPKTSVTTHLAAMLNGSWYRDSRGYYSHDTMLINANESYKFHIGPWIYEGRDWSPYVDGYAVLRVPVVRSSESPYGLIPQSKTAIPVLLSAIRTERWIKRNPPPPDLVTTSQSAFPLASGKAFNEITPETQPYQHPIRVREYIDEVKRGTISPARGSLGLPEEDRVQAALDLLNQMTNDQSDLDALNRMLEASGSVVRVVGSHSQPPRDTHTQQRPD